VVLGRARVFAIVVVVVDGGRRERRRGRGRRPAP